MTGITGMGGPRELGVVARESGSKYKCCPRIRGKHSEGRGVWVYVWLHWLVEVGVLGCSDITQGVRDERQGWGTRGGC